MRTLALLALLCACAGCASPQAKLPPTPPAAPTTHPFADKIFGQLFLKDGKTTTGRIAWNASTREYLVVESPRSERKIPADRVTRIVVLPSNIGIVLPTNRFQGTTVEILARVLPVVEGAYPTSLYASVGGPPRVELLRIGQTEQWKGQLNSTLVPNGTGTLSAIGWTPDGRRLTGSAPVTIDNPLKVFFADLHAHTSYSDGTFFPSHAFAYARNVSELDVFALTDHLELSTDASWRDTLEIAHKANDDGAFVTIPGLEWTKGAGHAVILDPGTRHWPTNVTEFYEAAAKAGVIAKFNHPGTGKNVFTGLAYSEIGDRAVELMEVRNATEEEAYIRALNLGWHLAPDGSDDTHRPNWGSRCWTGILAPGLTRRNIWAALKARHCYSTLDRNCRLSFSINGAVMGDIVEEPAKTLSAEVVVDDPDAKDAIAKIELYEDGVVVQTKQAAGSSCSWSTSCMPEPGKHYYFVKATQADGNILWSAPIWVTRVAE